MTSRYQDYKRLVEKNRGPQELTFYDKMAIFTILRDVKHKQAKEKSGGDHDVKREVKRPPVLRRSNNLWGME